MSYFPTVRGLQAVPLLAAASCVWAQTTVRAPADPLDAKAPVPALVYRSTLQDYRSLRDEPPLPWRQANDAVRDIGGWRVYAREARAPAATASAPSAVRKP